MSLPSRGSARQGEAQKDKSVWQGGGAGPEIFHIINDTEELEDVDGFADKAVGLEIVGAGDIGVGLRSGQHDYGNTAQARIGLDFAQDFLAVHAR